MFWSDLHCARELLFGQRGECARLLFVVTDTTTRTGRIAQLVEQRSRKAKVVGSIPTLASTPLSSSSLSLRLSYRY